MWFDAVPCACNSIMIRLLLHGPTCATADMLHASNNMDATSNMCATADRSHDSTSKDVASSNTKNLTCIGSETSIAAERSHDSTSLGTAGSTTEICTPNRSDIHDKILNLTDQALPDNISNMLSKGPNLALSRKVNKHVLLDVEKGIERSAFALRWKMHIDSKQQQKQLE